MVENDSIIESFLVWLGGSHSPATVQSYKFALYSLTKYLNELGKVLTACDLDDLSRYHIWLENRGLRGGTRALYVTSLRTLWKWLYRQGKVKINDDLIPVPQAVEKESHPFLEPQEFRAIMNLYDEMYPKELRDKTIVAFLYNTGLRLGEMLNLNIDCLDMKERKAVAKTFKRKHHKREVYWDEETNRLLERWLEVRERILGRKDSGTEALFISFNTATDPKRMDRSAVQKMFRAARAKLGIEKRITPHSCRHGFASLGVKRNVNLCYLQVMMGHANIRSTTIYMGYKNTDVEHEYRKVFEASFDASVDKAMPVAEPVGNILEQSYVQARKIAAESVNSGKVFVG
jgi:integrase/recombinase XerD